MLVSRWIGIITVRIQVGSLTFNGGVVTWKSSKQETVVDSMCELEYTTVSEASKEEIWFKNFIGDLGVVPSIKEPVEISVIMERFP